MELEEYFNFLAPNDIRVKGTRVGIETILYDYIYRSRSPQDIVASYPSLTLEQVYATSPTICTIRKRSTLISPIG